MTIHQQNVGTKKDHGTVGFSEESHAQYLIFPRSLRTFSDRKIIGVNYDLLAKDSRPVAASRESGRPKRRTTAAVKPKKRAANDDEKVVAFAPEPEPETNPAPAETKVAKATAPSLRAEEKRAAAADKRLLAVMRQAMKDLDAGKAVAAYKRLEKAVNEVDASG